MERANQRKIENYSASNISAGKKNNKSKEKIKNKIMRIWRNFKIYERETWGEKERKVEKEREKERKGERDRNRNRNPERERDRG